MGHAQLMELARSYADLTVFEGSEFVHTLCQYMAADNTVVQVEALTEIDLVRALGETLQTILKQDSPPHPKLHDFALRFGFVNPHDFKRTAEVILTELEQIAHNYPHHGTVNKAVLLLAVTSGMAKLNLEVIHHQIHDVEQNLDKVRRESHLQPSVKLTD
jgi:hypothetical protein